MRILLAAHAGFCFGVKRTICLAQAAAKEYGQVFSLGPLIHNPQEVARLEGASVYAVNAFDDIPPGAPLLVRSHGLPPALFAEARRRGLAIIDATCPLVKKAQRLAQTLVETGHNLVIVGDRNHPEIIGTMGWAYNKAVLVANQEEAAALPFLKNLAVISQTTQSPALFAAVAEVLQKKTNCLTICDTICYATRKNQLAAAALAKEVEAVLVVGGKNSANTKKLAQICSSGGIPTYHLETADDLYTYPNLMNGTYQVVGLTAGASTPDWIIEEVIGKMSETEKIVVENQVLAEENKEATSCCCQAEQDCAACQEECGDTPCYAAGTEGADVQAPVVAAAEEAAAEAGEVEQSFADAYNDIKEVRRGARVKGVVVQVKPDELLVDIGGKSEGVLPASELTADDAANILDRFKVGDEIEVLILKRENQEGYPVLSKKRIDQELAWDKLAQAKADGEIITGKVLEVVKGGLLVDVGLRGFVPASLVALGYVEDLNAFVGKELRLKVIDCERGANKLVLSAKAVLREEAQKQKAETWATIKAGEVRRGVVRRLTNFGAFVDIGGVDGLLHVSEMAWYRVNHPSDILKEGDEIDVYILAVDTEKEKISLGLKQLIANPWSLAKDKYPEGAIIQAKVVRTAPFGAFLEVEPGVEGLVHISQLAHHRVEKTEDVVTPGQIVDVKVLSVDPEAKRISLSIKGATEPPVEPEAPPVEYSTDDAEAAAEEE